MQTKNLFHLLLFVWYKMICWIKVLLFDREKLFKLEQKLNLYERTTKKKKKKPHALHKWRIVGIGRRISNGCTSCDERKQQLVSTHIWVYLCFRMYRCIFISMLLLLLLLFYSFFGCILLYVLCFGKLCVRAFYLLALVFRGKIWFSGAHFHWRMNLISPHCSHCWEASSWGVGKQCHIRSKRMRDADFIVCIPIWK